MLHFLKRLFRPRHPLDAKNLGERARNIAFREMEDNDVAVCLSFYRANEAKHFPGGQLGDYERKLRNREFLTLVATREGRTVGCCGIQYTTSKEGMRVGMFCYGMVDPPHQRQGIGTAQVLVRLGLLTATNDLAIAAMVTVPNSISFYQRFGFQFATFARADDGRSYPFGILQVSQSFINDCRAELAQRQITYPDVRDKIPIRTAT